MTVLWSDDRTIFTTVHPARYALGPPDAPLVTLNAVDGFGCAWAADEPEGWDAPDVETPSDAQPQAHGSWLGESFYPERVLTFTGGLCTAPTAQDALLARRRLMRALTASLSGLVEYTHLDEVPRRGLWVRPRGKIRMPMVDDRAFTFAFVLVAEDPLKHGDPLTAGPGTMRQPGPVPGRRYPRRYGQHAVHLRDYGGGEVSTVLFVPNVGEEDAHAIYRILGPIDRPLLIFPTQRWRLGFSMRLDDDDALVADTRSGIVTLNGVNRYDALTAGSAVPLIPPGGVDVELRSGSGGTYPDAQVLIDTAPTWL